MFLQNPIRLLTDGFRGPNLRIALKREAIWTWIFVAEWILFLCKGLFVSVFVLVHSLQANVLFTETPLKRTQPHSL